MTQPTMIGLLYDDGKPKIFLRGLLYATGKRGHIIEHMHVVLEYRQKERPFDVWMYGETSSLMIGSGLRVSEDGAAFNHHFASDDASPFDMMPGEFKIKVYAQIINRTHPQTLSVICLKIDEEAANTLNQPSERVLFSRQPHESGYKASISRKPEAAMSSIDPEERSGLIFPRRRR